MDDKNSLPTRSINQTMVVSLLCISKQKQMCAMPNGQYWVFKSNEELGEMNNRKMF